MSQQPHHQSTLLALLDKPHPSPVTGPFCGLASWQKLLDGLPSPNTELCLEFSQFPQRPFTRHGECLFHSLALSRYFSVSGCACFPQHLRDPRILSGCCGLPGTFGPSFLCLLPRAGCLSRRETDTQCQVVLIMLACLVPGPKVLT